MFEFISVVQDWGHYTKVTIMHHSGIGVVELFVYDDTDTAEIASLYVVSPMRGRGIAKMLIQQAEQKAKSLGAKRIKILSEPHLTTFYKVLGYKED